MSYNYYTVNNASTSLTELASMPYSNKGNKMYFYDVRLSPMLVLVDGPLIGFGSERYRTPPRAFDLPQLGADGRHHREQHGE